MRTSVRRVLGAAALLGLGALAGCNKGAGGAPAVAVQSESDKAVYALGLAVASNGPLPGLFGPMETRLICQGFSEAMKQDTLAINMPAYGPRVNGYVKDRMGATADTTDKSSKAPTAAADKTAATDADSIEYALGVVLAMNTLQPLHHLFSDPEVAIISRGVSDGILKVEPVVALETYGPKVDSLMGARMKQGVEVEKERGKAFRDKAASEAGAQAKPSGLIYTSLREGTGPSPTLTSTVKVQYTGLLVDGTVFDSSLERGPLTMALRDLVPAWQEGVQMMRVGGKARLVVPPELAYGDNPRGPIPGGSTLVFELELLGIQ